MDDPERILTAVGYDRLMAELEQLRTVRRSEIAEHLRVARDVGTWDNPDYLVALEEQTAVENRITVLERLLAEAEVVEVTRSTGWPSVGVGSTVVVRDEVGEEDRYAIVGAMESEPVGGRISNQSPVGKALLGHRPGDTVDVETPMGTRHLTILQVE